MKSYAFQDENFVWYLIWFLNILEKLKIHQHFDANFHATYYDHIVATVWTWGEEIFEVFCENVVGKLDFSFYYLKWGEQAPRTSLWHLISLSSVSKVTSKKSSSFLKSWNAVDKFDVKSFHFKQYFSPSTEPMVAVTILFNSMHITFSCQSSILKKLRNSSFHS